MIKVKAQPGEKKKAAPKRKAASGTKAKAKARTGRTAKPKANNPNIHANDPKPEAKSRGGNPPKLTETDIPRVIEVLRASGGLKTIAAQRLNVGRTTLYAFLDKHTEVEDALKDIDAEIGDLVEAGLLQLVRAGDPQTLRWYAELKLKDRGYVRRVENTGKGGGPVEVQQKADLADYTDEEVAIMAAAARRRKESRASNQG